MLFGLSDGQYAVVDAGSLQQLQTDGDWPVTWPIPDPIPYPVWNVIEINKDEWKITGMKSAKKGDNEERDGNVKFDTFKLWISSLAHAR